MRSRGLVLVLGLVGCGPSDSFGGSTGADTDSPGDTSGTGPGGTPTTMTATTTSTGPSATEGDSTAMQGDGTSVGDDDPDDGVATTGPGDDPCAAFRSERECLAWMDEGMQPDTACAWAQIETFFEVDDGGIECSHAHVARCIPIAYQGDGCGIPFTCDLAEPTADQVIWFRETDQASEVFLAVTPTLCEYQPVDFAACTWPEPTGGPIPPPRFGVPECNCLCEDL